MKKKFIKKMCVTAVFIALATVLSLITVFRMPLGGSVTLFSMVPIVLLTLVYGVKHGLFSAFLYSLIQLFIGITVNGLLGWGLSAEFLIGSVFFDYIIAFTVIGFSGVFGNTSVLRVSFGTALAVAVRFVCHTFSGGIFFASFTDWANVWAYSVLYNGLFMLPELIMTVAAVAVLYGVPQLKKALMFLDR